MNVFKKITKTIFIIVFSIILLVIVVLALPSTQDFISHKISNIVREKLNGMASIGEIGYKFPNKIFLNNALVLDKKNDTIIGAKHLEASVGILSLIHLELVLSRIKLSNTDVNIKKYKKDSVFNFSYLLPEKKEKDGEGNLGITVRNINLSDINFNYLDSSTMNAFDVKLDDLNVKISKLDIKKKEVEVRRFKLKNSDIHIDINQKKENKKKKKKDINLDVKLLRKGKLENVHFSVDNNVDNTELDIADINLAIETNEINLTEKNLHIEYIDLSGAKIAQISSKETFPQKNEDKKRGKKRTKNEWTIRTDKISIEKVGFARKVEGVVKEPAGFNANNFSVSNIRADVEDIKIGNETYSVNIKSVSLNDSKGFELENLEANLFYGLDKAYAKKMEIRTSHSIIEGEVSLKYNSPDLLKSNIASVYIHSNLSLQIDPSDVLHFQPSISEKTGIRNLNKARLAANIQVEGPVGHIDINSIRLEHNSKNTVHIKGEVEGLPDFKKAKYALQSVNIDLYKNELLSHLPYKQKQSMGKLPSRIRLDGKFKGSIQDFESVFWVKTADGKFRVIAKINDMGESERQRFEADIKGLQSDLSRFTGDKSPLGSINLSARVEGSMTDYDMIEAKGNIDISELGYNGYTYNNIIITGQYESKAISAEMNIEDASLQANLTSDISMEPKLGGKFSFDLAKADLQNLGFSKDKVLIAVNVNSEFEGDSLRNLKTTTKMAGLHVVREDKEAKFDTIKIVANNVEGNYKYKFTSGFLEANYEGNMAPEDLRGTLKTHFKSLANGETDSGRSIGNSKFELNAQLIPSAKLTNLMTEEEFSYSASLLKANYSQSDNMLKVVVSLPRARFNKWALDSLNGELDSEGQKMNYALGFSGISSENIRINRTEIKGKTEEDHIVNRFIMSGNDTANKYLLEFMLQGTDSGYMATIDDNKLILNYNEWEVNKENNIRFYEEVAFQDMVFTRDNKEFSIASEKISGVSDYKLSFDNFNINTIVSLVETENKLIDGTINGYVEIGKTDHQNVNISSDMRLNRLSLMGEQLFAEVKIKVKRNKDNNYGIEMGFHNKSREAYITGIYDPFDSVPNFDISMRFDGLGFEPVKALTNDQFSQFSGILYGDINMEGNTKEPQINGRLNFKNTRITPTFLNATLILEDEELDVKNNTLIFTDFDIIGKKGNTASIKGDVELFGSKGMRTNVRLKADDFIVLDKENDYESLFYGKVRSDISAHIKGSINAPEVTIDADVQDNSNFTLIIPSNQEASISQEGIVEFVSSDTAKLKTAPTEEGLGQDEQKANIKLNAKISITKSTKIKAVVDPLSNEHLVIQGSGTLGFKMRRGEPYYLSGRYDISEGKYSMKIYNLVTREFIIKESSYISWTGNIMEPTAYIKSIYKVEAPPSGLVANEYGVSEEQLQQYNKNMPFIVQLELSGQLLGPEIDFDIKTPPGVGDALIKTKLQRLNQNESELNKQVFSLFLLKSFTAQTDEKPFAYELNNTARRSMSSIINRQVNQFIGNNIEFIDLSVDVSSSSEYYDETQYGQTNVGVNVSKDFFDDRLSVSVGGNVDIEDSEKGAVKENENGALNNLAGDFMVEYKLTKSGFLKLMFYNKSEYEDVLTGEVNKTGIGLNLNKNFRSFGELFINENKDKN